MNGIISRLSGLLLAAVMLLVLAACGGARESEKSEVIDPSAPGTETSSAAESGTESESETEPEDESESSEPEDSEPESSVAESGADAATAAAWWSGDWYGWWLMSDCAGCYEGMDNYSWDICGRIKIADDLTGTIALWDEDYTCSEPMSEATVELITDGTGEYGVLYSDLGYFTDMRLADTEWAIDPEQTYYSDMIFISGHYENGENAYEYSIVLRPWGTVWDDVDEDSLPNRYTDWYLPLIEAGESMPEQIDARDSSEE